MLRKKRNAIAKDAKIAQEKGKIEPPRHNGHDEEYRKGDWDVFDVHIETDGFTDGF